jgi:hypothetical protein
MATIRLKVTSAISTSTNFSVTNASGEVINRSINLATGDCVCDTYWTKSYADEVAGFDKFVPAIIVNDKITKRVGGVTVNLTQQEITGANLPLTILTKVAAKLTADYGWTVIVESV